MINKNDLRKAISSIAISNAKRNTIYRAFSDLDSITKEEFDSVKSDISKVVESMLTKDTVGKANGVASLDSNGSVPIEQLGNIDTTLFLIVRELPTTDIQSDKIYLVPNQDGQGNNVYIEYLYVEDAWEKVGEFKPEVDLSGYAEKSSSIKNIYGLAEGKSKTFTRIEGNNFAEALIKEGNFVGVVINIKIPNSQEQWSVANNSNGVPFIIDNESPTDIKVSIGNDEYFIINNYRYWIIDGEKYIRAFWMPECFAKNSSSDKIVYGLLSSNVGDEKWFDISKISSKTTINDVKFVDVTDYDNFSGNLKQPIGTLIASRSKNNIAIEYADGHIERFNKTDDIRIGGYAEYSTYNSFYSYEYYSYFTKDASLEVNGSLKCRDLTTKGKAEINGSLTVNGQAEIDGTINNNNNPLKVGETTINGTLHVEYNDIKTKSVYPANTGSSSLKDQSKGKVPGNYVVTKSNLGKGAHNYDKLFVENIYWSDCTNISDFSTSLNNEGTIQILNARGINGKPVWIFDGIVDDSPNCDFLGIYATNYNPYSIANIIVFEYSNDSNSEVHVCGHIYFDVDNCTISDSIDDVKQKFVFGNGVHYNEYNKIPFDFIDLPDTINLPNKIDLNFNEPGYIYLENTVDSTASITIKLKNESSLYLDSGRNGKSNLVYATDGSWFDLATKADASAIPTKLSQLTNDSFPTSNDIAVFAGLNINNNAKIKYIQKTNGDEGTYLIAETPADRVANKVYAADGSLFDVGKVVKTIDCKVSGDSHNIEFGYTNADNERSFILVPNATKLAPGIMTADDKVKLDSLPSITGKLSNITAATTAEEVVTKFNALLADLKAKGYMEADTPQ